jgi:hypothetical protein
MSQDKEPLPPDRRPLGYWHSSDRASSRFSLGLSLCVGIFTSVVIAFLFGGMCAFGSLASGSSVKGKALARGVAGTWAGCFIAAVFLLLKYRNDGLDLSFEERRQPARYFQLGILIGFGLAALLEGICFGAASASP